jgi:hypothetical protein
MSFPLDFDGRSFANRRRLAKYLAPVSGLSITSCIELMKRHENDPATAIAQLQSPSPLHYDGRSFRRPTDLARYLTTIVGGKRSVEAVRVMLRCKGHDPAAVVAHYRAIDTRFFARVGSQIYRTKKDFIRYVNRYYGIPAGTVTAWLNAGEPIADVLSAAKEHRTTTPAASYWQGPVVLFGWRFASFTALCRYYGRSPTSWNHKWREHAAGGGTAARFSPLLVRSPAFGNGACSTSATGAMTKATSHRVGGRRMPSPRKSSTNSKRNLSTRCSRPRSTQYAALRCANSSGAAAEELNREFSCTP